MVDKIVYDDLDDDQKKLLMYYLEREDSELNNKFVILKKSRTPGAKDKLKRKKLIITKERAKELRREEHRNQTTFPFLERLSIK